MLRGPAEAAPGREASGKPHHQTPLSDRATGASLFSHAWRLSLAAVLTGALLQAAFFFRPTPYGAPFVAHWDRFFFHALFYDTMTTLVLSLPIMLFATCCFHRSISPRVLKLIFSLQALVLVLNAVANHLDHEVMRFMGTHLSLSFIATYARLQGSESTISSSLSTDLGGPYVPFALFIVPLALAVYAGLSIARWRDRPKPAHRVWPLLWALIPITVLLIVYATPGGRFRINKVQPVAMLWWRELLAGIRGPQAPENEAELKAAYVERWLAAHPEGGWHFPDPKYPFLREPTTAGDALLASQSADRPSAVGLAAGYNVVLLQLESFRAWNMGIYNPELSASPTPYLDALAQKARSAYWTRHHSFGPPTISGFFALNASATPHQNRNLSTDFTYVSFLSLPELLRANGYRTEFVTGSDPDWDNERFWLLRWYDDYHFVRDANEHDREVFAFAAERLRSLGRGEQPFFVSLVSISNHYPFDSKDPDYDLNSSREPGQKILNTMHYTDQAVQELIEGLRDEPWFDKTLWIVVGDHGYNLGEHDGTPGQRNLFHESTWVPLIISGLPEGIAAGPRHDVASLLDFAPTVSSLLGIRVPVPWQGMDLLQPRAQRSLLFARGDLAFAETPEYSVVRDGNTGSLHLFAADDPLQSHDLIDSHAELARSLIDAATGFSALNDYTIETDRVWPQSR
ncbi:MAG: LTA synthase family protein [Myxococcota bacterium]|jgi:arylsulfatase A-like enzyme|nr:LTA synthase family protein [Myxococcota bacterium]